MIDAEELLKKFEPEIADKTCRILLAHYGDTLMLASIAISMKRIADALDHFKTYGVEGV